MFSSVALVLAACGSSSGTTTGAPAGGGAATTAGAVGVDPTANGGGDGGGAPVTATVDGTTFGYPMGTCDVSADRVIIHAFRPDVLAAIDVSWLSDGGRETFDVVHTGGLDPKPPTPFDLHASPTEPETTWDVSVDGTTAVIEAHMVNQHPNAVAPTYEVTIRVQCNERGFGGMSADPTEGPAGTPLPEATLAGESALTLELDGNTYAFTYPGCAATDGGGFVAMNPELIRLFLGGGNAQVNLPDGSEWIAQSVQLDVSGVTATWTGSMTSSTGRSSAARLTIDC